MKMMKKLAMILLAVCLIVPCFATSVYAADVKVQFSDHESETTGEEIEVTFALKADAVDSVGNFEVQLTYDSSIIRFKSGTGATESEPGKLTVQGSEVNLDYRVKLIFDVLKKGTTKIEIESCSISAEDGSALTYVEGAASIKVTQGEDIVDVPVDTPVTTGTTVEVNGQTYELSGNFTEVEIPEGFVEATLNYAGADHKVVQHETYGMYLGYLVNAQQEGQFFVYNEEDATFSPFIQVQISDRTSLIFLADTSDVVVPKEYQATTVTFNGTEFPAWQSVDRVEYCLLYAVNNQGDKALYQFDSIEGTYQRFEVEETTSETETVDNSWFGKLRSSLENHLDTVILVGGLGFLFFLFMVVVLAVKLHNRNAELDELYDEYDIDVEDEEPEVKKEKKGLFKKSEKEDELKVFEDFDDIEIYNEEEDAADDIAEEIEETVAEEVSEEIEIKDIQEEDELEDFYGKLNERFAQKQNDSSTYEDFDLDFIDLDD